MNDGWAYPAGVEYTAHKFTFHAQAVPDIEAEPNENDFRYATGSRHTRNSAIYSFAGPKQRDLHPREPLSHS